MVVGPLPWGKCAHSQLRDEVPFVEPQWQLISERRKLARLKLREGKQLAQDHTANKWQSQDEETKTLLFSGRPVLG